MCVVVEEGALMLKCACRLFSVIQTWYITCQLLVCVLVMHIPAQLYVAQISI